MLCFSFHANRKKTKNKIWFGKKKKDAKAKFYKILSKIANKKYDHSLATTNEKISNLSIIASNTESDIRSHTLSGCPSDTDSEVNKYS